MDKDATLKRYTLTVVVMASFLTTFIGSSVNLAIPSIGRQFNSSAILLSWVVTGYLLTSAAFLVPFGRLADIMGRKRIFLTGIIVFSFASLACGLAWSAESLILFRVLQGVGSSMVFGNGMAMLTSVYPPQERGKVLGIYLSTVYVGLSLGPVLGGVLNHNLGWQSIFFLVFLIGLVVVVFTAFMLRGEWAGARGERFDLAGSVLYSVGLITFIYGMSSVSRHSWEIYVLAAGAAILAFFVKYELGVDYPVLNMRLFTGNVTFAFSNLAALINYSATYTLGFLLSLHLQVVLGFNSQTAGLVLLSQPVIMALLSPFAGRLSDRVEPRVVASLGMALTTAGLLVFCFLNKDMPIWLIILNLGVQGTGFALFSSPNSSAVMGSVEKRFYGVASSTLGTMRLVGQTASMAIVTLVVTLFIGNVELGRANPEMLVKGARTAFIIFTLLCFAGIFASLKRGNVIAGPGQE